MQKRPLVIHTQKKNGPQRMSNFPCWRGLGGKSIQVLRIEKKKNSTWYSHSIWFSRRCIAAFCGSISRLFVSWPTRTVITISSSLWDRKKLIKCQMPAQISTWVSRVNGKGLLPDLQKKHRNPFHLKWFIMIGHEWPLPIHRFSQHIVELHDS